jgi:hypothetical protein
VFYLENIPVDLIESMMMVCCWSLCWSVMNLFLVLRENTELFSFSSCFCIIYNTLKYTNKMSFWTKLLMMSNSLMLPISNEMKRWGNGKFDWCENFSAQFFRFIFCSNFWWIDWITNMMMMEKPNYIDFHS